jgi:hypothetical protein
VTELLSLPMAPAEYAAGLRSNFANSPELTSIKVASGCCPLAPDAAAAAATAAAAAAASLPLLMSVAAAPSPGVGASKGCKPSPSTCCCWLRLGLGGSELEGVEVGGVEAEPPACCRLDPRRARSPWLGTLARTGPNSDCRMDCGPGLHAGKGVTTYASALPSLCPPAPYNACGCYGAVCSFAHQSSALLDICASVTVGHDSLGSKQPRAVVAVRLGASTKKASLSVGCAERMCRRKHVCCRQTRLSSLRSNQSLYALPMICATIASAHQRGPA